MSNCTLPGVMPVAPRLPPLMATSVAASGLSASPSSMNTVPDAGSALGLIRTTPAL